ncbi:ATP-binding protein [Sporosarcina sp. E16_8]|uniref:sensor histidine kinase n=1 Tax=Sporosarcina sp. E16_8 TaxID=2789295 RepID=UPI001A92B16B|nr:ATP-binding protein [Sporosarcina sp. E16_8]MBO0588891.1 ATP-binding protein [Sporosarcina sp. E16_8]
MKEIIASIIKLTQSDEAFFWLTDANHQNSHLASSTNNTHLETILKKEWHTIRLKKELFVDRFNEVWYGMKVIKTPTTIGVIGVRISSSTEAQEAFLLNRPFAFLVQLIEIMLERIQMDSMKEQMIVLEEQNRIADEIHDSVSQRLFGIVYSLHSLQSKSKDMTTAELNDEHQFLSQSANTTLKELRSAIYNLSSTKNGEKPFLVRLKNYLDDYARLSDIRIDYQLTGDEALLSSELKQALYRIVCEACGNAVRHGRCTTIELRLSLLDERTLLDIHDNGIGFNPQLSDDLQEKGIGLFNMKRLVSTFAGSFSIDGFHGLGTEIQIEIPTTKILEKVQVIG